MNIALYARVSSERQAEKDLSIPAQLKALRKYALQKDWDIVAEFVDEAESARTANRPAFQEMIAAAKKRERPFETILVWKLSRFARNREDAVLYKALLRRKGISVLSINEQVDESPAGHLLEGIIEVIDEFYSMNLAQDTMRGLEENASRGFRNGGSVPFGYKSVKVKLGTSEKSKLAPNEREAPIVRRIFKLALQGRGGKEIAKTLNADGLRTRAGNHFGATGINNILRNAAYTGTLVWNEKRGDRANRSTSKSSEVVRTPNSHEALVSQEDFDRVAGLLVERRPTSRHPRTISSQFLVSGILHCGKCGSAMVGTSAKSGQFFYYACNGRYKKGEGVCDVPMINKGKLERLVVDRIKENVLTDGNLRQLVDLVNEELSRNGALYEEQLSEIDEQLVKVERKLTKLYAALESGKVDIDDLAPRLKELRTQQRQLQGKRGELQDRISYDTTPVTDLAAITEYVSDLRGLLGSASFTEQKAFLRSFVQRVEFSPPQVTIHYTIPLPPHHGLTSTREVLRINKVGSAGRIRTYDPPVNSRLLYH